MKQTCFLVTNLLGRIGMASASAISNMARDGFLYRPTTNKEISDKKTSLFHDFPEDLQIAAIMCAVQEAPATIQSNTYAVCRYRNSKQDRDNLMNQEGFDKVTDEFIQCLIYRQMWDSDQRWRTAGEVKKRLEL